MKNTISTLSHIEKWLFLIVVGLWLNSVSAIETDVLQKGIVRVYCFAEKIDYFTPWNSGSIGRGTGTGFFIGDSWLLTNAHVVSNARYLAVKREGDPQPYPARIKYIAHDCDLALLEVEDESFFEPMTALEFGDMPALSSEVQVIGYPIGGERISVTSGVVSRIEIRPYAHSGVDAHLAIQIDAAINPGNSGGPVFQDGKVVGVAFQGISGQIAQNTGYMIPTPVVRRFLKDVEDGSYDGYAELGIFYFNLSNPSYRASLGLPDDGIGVVVTKVAAGGSCDGWVEKGDVLIGIDGHSVNAAGKIKLDGQFVSLEEVVERKLIGTKVELDLIRNGQRETVRFELKGFPYSRITANAYGEKPRYLIFAGLVFQPLSRNLIMDHGITNDQVLDMFSFYVPEELYVEHPEVIVLSRILSDPINTYMNDFVHGVVESVNDQQIRTLADLARVLGAPAERYVIRFAEEGRPLVIEAAQLAEAQQRIATQYSLPATRNLE
jgi:S1-C subfamily serine protease